MWLSSIQAGLPLYVNGIVKTKGMLQSERVTKNGWRILQCHVWKIEDAFEAISGHSVVDSWLFRDIKKSSMFLFFLDFHGF